MPWTNWLGLGGGSIISSPAAVSWGPNRIDVFAQGTDQLLYTRTWNGAAWTGWTVLGGGPIVGAPSVASWGPQRLDVFARGTDDKLYTRSWAGSKWSDWTSLGGGSIISSPAAVSWGPNRIDVFAQGTDRLLYTRSWDGNAWTAWTPLGGGPIVGAPSVASWGPQRLDVFARGTDDELYTRSWVQAPSLAAFGHGSMVENGKPAVGPRRLAVVLAQYDNDAEGRFPPFSNTHDANYYNALCFGDPAPPFSTREPVNPASLSSYFRENSLGRFWCDRAGLVGPLVMGPLGDDPGPEERSRRILDAAARVNSGIFFDSDLDGNDLIGSNELLVLIVENFAGLLPANRDNYPLQIKREIHAVGPLKTVNIHVAFVGPRTPFYQIAHELSHSLGTDDLYGDGGQNVGLTLMSSYPFFTDDQGSVHLDCWHKLVLGWCEPRRRDLNSSGAELLGQLSPSRPTAALLLWHLERGTSEFFLLEERTNSGTARRYDAQFNGDGVVIWRVAVQAGAGVTSLGSPSLVPGGNVPWTSGQVTPPLTWADGTSTGVKLAFDKTVGGMRVRWPM